MSGRIETYDSRKEQTSKWSQNEAFSVREAGVDIGKDGGQGGSNVSVDQVVTSGREVAGVTVDGHRTAILVPNEGSFVQSDWDESDPSEDAYIKNKPTLASVATSGSYDDLSDKPDLSGFVNDPNYVHTDNNFNAAYKAAIDGLDDALAGKVDKVSGKVLSDNNYSTLDKQKVSSLADIYYVGTGLTLDPATKELTADAQHIDVDNAMSSASENPVQNKVITAALGDKVDKVSGKVLSDNNFSNSDKQKLDGIDQGAEVNDISTISVNGDNVPADANKNVDITIPTKVSDLTNDSGFITNTVTNLTNYYLKSETYTQAEINTLIAAITTLDIEVVNALPVSDISTTTIYLVPKATAGTQDVYDEWINIDGTGSGWEHIGSTEIDLTNYYTKSEVNTLLSAKANSADLATVATSGSYDDLSDKPTIPTVNNGVLTITQNGATLGTFSANQGNNATIDIPGGSSGAGAVILQYGQSTWAEALNAAQTGKALYCMVINGNVGNVASLSKITVSGGNYTEFEFQYHSSETHTAVNPSDKLYTYKITNAGVWSTTSTNIVDITAGHTVKDAEGTALTQRANLQIGGMLKASDDSTNGATVISDLAEEVDWSVWNAMSDAEREAYSEGKKIDLINVPNIDGKISVDMLTKLWENPNPSAEFGSQHITLASDDYDYLLWVFGTSNKDITSSVISEKGNTLVLSAALTNRGTYGTTNVDRNIIRIADTDYRAENGYVGRPSEGSSVDNTVCKPLAIYGIKKSISFDVSVLVSDVSTSADKCMLSDGETSVEDAINGVKHYKVSGTTASALNTEVVIPFPDGADPSKIMYIGSICRSTNGLYYSNNSDIKFQTTSNLGVRITVTGTGFLSQPITVLLAEI